MNRKEIISEISRMKSLFGYKKGVVLSEQIFAGQNPAQFSTTQQQSGFLVDCTGVGGLPTTAQMQQNFATNSGLNPKTPKNKIFFCDTTAMNKKLNELKPNQTQQRLTNISATFSKVDAQGIIRSPGSAFDGTPWNSYVETYQIRPDEIESVKATLSPANAPKTQQQQQPQFVAEKFPLKYMMQGEKVKQLQQALGLKTKSGQPNISGKFYNATQTALDTKARELGITYDRNKGLDETSFNQILQSAQPAQTERKTNWVGSADVPGTQQSLRNARPSLTTSAPTTLPQNLKMPQIQPIQTQLTLDQQFQVAKANLDAAKAELDAAQKTDDRVAIGTARGKQQAARQEVRRLRGELAAQNQPQ